VKICFDTNVILDVLLEREPWYTSSVSLLLKAEKNIIEAYLCPTTITTIAYLIQKHKNKKIAKELISHLLNIFNLSHMDKDICQSALSLDFNDYEDAVLHESARNSGMDAIVTRNPRVFRQSSLRIYSPEELDSIV
jgi:predicted nucleic acid-binding protein